MNEEFPRDTVAELPGATAGALVRAAREARGIDLAALAAMLKIPLRKLEALEEDRYGELQGPTFVRALAQAACRALKIDPKPVLALLPQSEGNTLEQVNGGLNAPFRERGGRVELGDAGLALRPAVLLPLLLVVVALAMFFVPAGMLPHWGRSDVEVVAEAASAASDAGTVAGAAAPAPATAAAGSAPPAAGSAAAVAPAGPAAAADPVAASAVPTDEVLAHAAAPVGVPVLVKASADTWIEVTDAQGHALLSRTVVAGESVGLDGAMPMRVKIGNAAATVLSLRGDNVDLNPWTRDNVARLELK